RRQEAGGAETERNLNGDRSHTPHWSNGKQRHSFIVERRIAEFVDSRGDARQRIGQWQGGGRDPRGGCIREAADEEGEQLSWRHLDRIWRCIPSGKDHGLC